MSNPTSYLGHTLTWKKGRQLKSFDTNTYMYNAVYYFRKNLQGDIIAITNSNAVNVAIYTYDAWGKCTIVSDTSGCNIATNVIVSVINPTVGAYIVKMIGTIRSTIRTAAKVLVPFLPILGSL